MYILFLRWGVDRKFVEPHGVAHAHTPAPIIHFVVFRLMVFYWNCVVGQSHLRNDGSIVAYSNVLCSNFCLLFWLLRTLLFVCSVFVYVCVCLFKFENTNSCRLRKYIIIQPPKWLLYLIVYYDPTTHPLLLRKCSNIELNRTQSIVIIHSVHIKSDFYQQKSIIIRHLL